LFSPSLRLRLTVNATDKDGKTPLALLEDMKIKEYQWPNSEPIDFKAVEILLLEHGAKGPILSPKPSQMPTVIF
jgi:hypothetical protein